MDYDEVAILLGIVEKAAQHGGKLSAIAGAAMTRLLEINEELRQESIETAKAARVAEAEANAPKVIRAPDEGDEDPATKPAASSRTATIADNNARRL